MKKRKAVRSGLFGLPGWSGLIVFLVLGQLLMRLTGYSEWAEQTGQPFMLNFICYMSMAGVLFAGQCLLVLREIEDASKS